MSKELEVLIKNAKNIVNKYEEWAIGEIKNFADKNEWSLKLMSGFIEKAITPPTQEEVCKALSEYLKKKVVFKNNKFYGYYRRFNNFSESKYEKEIIGFYDDDIYIGIGLPPRLITLIGRFYEGERK